MENDNTIDTMAFITNFAESIDGVAPNAIVSTTKLSDIAEWDSLAVLITITMADTKYDTEIQAKEVNACNTIQDLIQLIASKRSE